MPKNTSQLVAEVKAVWDEADREGRDLTMSERTDMQERLDAIKAQKSMEDIGRQLGGGMEFITGELGSGVGWGGGSPGERFTASKGYQQIKSAGNRGQSWTSGLVDVGLQTKGTLLEGSGSPGTGSGGGLLPVPQVVPGVVGKLFQRLTLEDLLLGGQATGNTVRYAVQGTATSGAQGVPEAGTKPESTLGFGVQDEPIRKVATSIQIADELIEDAPAISAFINGQLSLFISIEVERQLFRGTSGGNEVQGILTSRGVPVYAGGTAAGNYAEQLFKAINGTRGSSFTEPEWVVMHPADWEKLRLLKDTANQLYGGGPFLGQYGAQAMVTPSGQVNGALDTVWNKAVVVTASIGGAGTALIGSSAAAQVWSRGGVVVESTNSHGGNFVLDITAIRAERRLGLCVYRPGALCEVRLA